nr:phage minor capsid protein [Bifidobacterium sp. ESL0784]
MVAGVQFAATRLRRETVAIVNQLDAQTPVLLENLVDSVRHETAEQAKRIPPSPPSHVGVLQPPEPPQFDFTVPLGQRATDAIRVDLQTELKNIRARILRQQNDIYKLTAAGAATHSVQANGDPIRVSQQRMMTDLLQHGTTGFTDRAGRDWQLSSYVEMAVRTATIRALNEAHLQVMTAAGITLFTVPTHVHTCPRCFAWQGKLLSRTPDPRADATIDEARAHGLFHPNCEHSIVAWHEGDKLQEPREWSADDERMWKASQQQRELERRIRTQKRVLLASPAPEMRAAARKKIHDYRAQLKGLTDSTGLLRRPNREQIDLGLKPKANTK